MASSFSIYRSLVLVAALTGISSAEPIRIVFQGGYSIPVAALVLQGPNYVLNAEVEGFTVGQQFPAQTADHVFGDRPADVRQGIALLVMDKPRDAVKVLEPAVARLRLTAKVPGNYWVEAARAAMMAYALAGNSPKCTELGKEVSDATPESGIDPFVSLSKVLLMPEGSNNAERIVALKDLISDANPASVCGFASFFIGNLFKEDNRLQDALEAYLTVPAVYPTSGLILNAGAQSKAAELLMNISKPEDPAELLKSRRDEAVGLLKSALPAASGTTLADDLKKRLESTSDEVKKKPLESNPNDVKK